MAEGEVLCREVQGEVGWCGGVLAGSGTSKLQGIRLAVNAACQLDLPREASTCTS